MLAGMLHLAYLYANDYNFQPLHFGLSYLVNYVMAVAIYATLSYLAEKESSYVGFMFLAGSALKFVVYFLILDPLFRADGSFSTYEFFLFFVPYLVCLIAETLALVKLLRKNG